MGEDLAGVRALAAELGLIRSRLQPVMRAVTSKAALNIKNDAIALIRDQVSGKYVKQYPNSITYDIAVGASSVFVEAEIGPDRSKPQGPLGDVLEHGTSRNPPYPHLEPALDNEVVPYEEFLSQAAADVVFGP